MAIAEVVTIASAAVLVSLVAREFSRAAGGWFFDHIVRPRLKKQGHRKLKLELDGKTVSIDIGSLDKEDPKKLDHIIQQIQTVQQTSQAGKEVTT